MTALEPLDRQLLDFLCSVEANRHCIVRSVKTRLRPSLRRLRYAGLVWFDSFTPSASAMTDWRARNLSPPSPGGAAGEEPPTPTAADEEGGAVARLLSAPPTSDDFKCGHPRTVDNTRIVGRHRSQACKRCWREALMASLQKRRSTRQENTPGADGTARKAPVAEESTSASRATGSAPFTFRCGHPRTEENSQAVGRHRGPTCKTCRSNRWRATYEARREEREAAKAARPPSLSDAQIRGQRVAAKVRRATSAKARERIERGLDARTATQATVRHAQFAIEAENAIQARLSDPVGQAKAKLQRRYAPVVSMAVYGGDPDLFVVGNRKGVTRDELLAMAERLAA